MPNAQCPMPNAQEHLMLLRKAISQIQLQSAGVSPVVPASEDLTGETS
jgi:hypothetical protein